MPGRLSMDEFIKSMKTFKAPTNKKEWIADRKKVQRRKREQKAMDLAEAKRRRGNQ